MAKTKQPSGKVADMIEGDAVEKPAQAKKSRPSDNSAKSFGLEKPSLPVLVIALIALVFSVVALSFAGFAVWNSNHQAAIRSPKLGAKAANTGLSEMAENRLATLEAKLKANRKTQQKAIADLSKRVDQQANAKLKMDSGDISTLGGNFVADNKDKAQMDARIDQRFFKLEMAIKELVTAKTVKPAVPTNNNAATSGKESRRPRPDLGATSDHANLLIASGLLADNMAGSSLDRWINLLQRQADNGVVIPNLAQLRTLANLTPERPFSLIKNAHDLIPEMISALHPANDDAGFVEKAGAKLGRLVRLREIGDEADGNEAVLHEFEAALATLDLDGAIRAASQWSGPDVPSLKNWLALAQSRRSLDRAVKALVIDRLDAAFAVH